MAAGQPVEPGACEMEAAQQLDPAGPRIDLSLLSLVDFEEGEGGPTTREAVADKRYRARRAWQHFACDPVDLGGKRRAFGNDPVDFAPDLCPRNGNFGFGHLCFRIGARDIATVGGTVAERDRTSDHDRHVIALPEMA